MPWPLLLVVVLQRAGASMFAVGEPGPVMTSAWGPNQANYSSTKPLAHLFLLALYLRTQIGGGTGAHTPLESTRPAPPASWRASDTTPRATSPSPSLLCRVRTALDEMSNGEFKRKESQFRNHIKRGGEYEPEGTWHRAWGRTSRPSAPLAVPVEALLQLWTA